MIKPLNWYGFALASMLLFSSCTAKTEKNDNSINVVTSFYPIYIIAENVIGDTENINLVNMAPPQTGCLHDYQLTTGDMKRLSNADAFIINGGGMESFIDISLDLYPKLNVIDTSEGTICLDSEVHENEKQEEYEEHHDHDHDHEENSHFWILPDNAIIQAENICTALCEICPENSDTFRSNTRKFINEIQSLGSLDSNGIKVCVFNEAFEYFKLSYNMEIAACVEMDENEMPSAKDLAELIKTVDDQNIKLLIAADDAGEAIANTIARETNARVLKLDPILTGNFSSDGYLTAIRKNTEILRQAIQEDMTK